MAYDVRFQFSDPLPNRAWGMDVEGAETAQPMRSGPLIDGIPTLAPGETRVIDWGQRGGAFRRESRPSRPEVARKCRA
jgi:hypothetical protein